MDVEKTRTKRGKAAQSNSATGDGGTAGRVSEMRGNDLPHDESSVLGVGGLSGMQPSDPHGVAKEVSVSPQAVEPGPTLGTELIDRINLLNAFKAILHKVPKVSAESGVQSFIKIAYQKWVMEMMDRLLTPDQKKPNELFSQDEAKALKTLAQTILQRQAQPQATPSSPPPKPINQNSSEPKKRPEPLKEAVNTEELNKAQMSILRELRRLEDLENQGPSF